MAGKHRRSRPYGDWWLLVQLVRLAVKSLITWYGDGPDLRS
jgi:hypothetical protein